MLDKLCISLTGEELEVVERLYLQAIKLEVEYFATQPVGKQSVLPFSLLQDPADSLLSIFCDFDMTCSAVDTSDILAEIAITSGQKVDTHGPDSQLTQLSSTDLRSTWSTLAVQYVGEHDRCVDSIIPSKTGLI
uniref:Uncharacterized protein n=1 Tax=Rhizophora mucronata TaxID=61149 RepID=A0A2P2P1K3_RHIMU